MYAWRFARGELGPAGVVGREGVAKEMVEGG